MSVSKNCAEMDFFKIKTSASTRMRHDGEQKPCENELFGHENGDANEDLAFQGYRNLKIVQKTHEFR